MDKPQSTAEQQAERLAAWIIEQSRLAVRVGIRVYGPEVTLDASPTDDPDTWTVRVIRKPNAE